MKIFNIYFPLLEKNNISVGGNHKIIPPDEVISETPIVINLWKKNNSISVGENGMTHRKNLTFPKVGKAPSHKVGKAPSQQRGKDGGKISQLKQS